MFVRITVKYVINLPINFIACVRSIAKFTSCINGLKYHKIRYKSRENNLIELFQLCTGSLWRILKFSDIYNIGIMPGDRLCCVTYKSLSRKSIKHCTLRSIIVISCT